MSVTKRSEAAAGHVSFHCDLYCLIEIYVRPWLPHKKCGGPNLANTHEPSKAIIPRLANLHAIHNIEGIVPTATGGNYDSVQCCRQVDFSALMMVCLLRSTE